LLATEKVSFVQGFWWSWCDCTGSNENANGEWEGEPQDEEASEQLPQEVESSEPGNSFSTEELRFTPLLLSWVKKWRRQLELVEKLLSQPGNSHENGFSPVWDRMCCFKALF